MRSEMPGRHTVQGLTNARLQLTSILLNVRPCDANLLRASVLQYNLDCTCAHTVLINCL